METIYTRQNGRAAPCSIESPRKYFNQGVEILGHRVKTLLIRTGSHTAAGTNTICARAHSCRNGCHTRRCRWRGSREAKPTCVLFSLGVIREVPNQAKTNWSRPLRGPQSDELISIPLTRNEPVLSQAENGRVGSVYSENKWACLRLYTGFSYSFFFVSRGQWIQWFRKDCHWEITEDEDKIWWM